MTPRLPIPGQDDNVWGDILNAYLSVSLNSDGTLKPSAITTAGVYSKPSGGIPSSDLSSGVVTSLNLANSALQSAPVSSVAGRTGSITLTTDDISFNPSTSLTTELNGLQGSINNNAGAISGAVGAVVWTSGSEPTPPTGYGFLLYNSTQPPTQAPDGSLGVGW